MALVLIGAPAAGKTRVGKRVATRLGRPFIDTDARIVAEHGPIPEIFAREGEARFREYERVAVVDALHQDAVVSLGGGAVTHSGTRDDLAAHRVVLLTTTEEAVAARLTNGKRPLIRSIDDWRALVERRRPLYEALATRTWDTSRRPIDEVADEIAAWERGEA